MSFSKVDPIVADQADLPPRALSTILREARISRSYSIEDLAVASGLTTAEIAGIETGESAKPDYFHRLARVLNLPMR